MCQILLKLHNGILKGHHVPMDVVAQLQDLLFAVQNLNALCVWVVTGTEWPRDSGCIGSGRGGGGELEGKGGRRGRREGEERGESDVVRVTCTVH